MVRIEGRRRGDWGGVCDGGWLGRGGGEEGGGVIFIGAF